ncbi:hypothetical protein Trydic_g21701 [Trypoxylus dichotomus]
MSSSICATFVHCQRSEHHNKACSLPSVKQRSGTVTVGEYFTCIKIYDVLRTAEEVQKKEYLTLQSGSRIIDQLLIYQQDNDTRHAANILSELLGRNKGNW